MPYKCLTRQTEIQEAHPVNLEASNDTMAVRADERLSQDTTVVIRNN